MKVKTCKLKDKALDWAVAASLDKGTNLTQEQLAKLAAADRWEPSTDWGQGGMILDAEKLSISPAKNDGYMAWAFPKGNGSWGETYLMAAMRCYVTSKFGNFIDIPEELL